MKGKFLILLVVLFLASCSTTSQVPEQKPVEMPDEAFIVAMAFSETMNGLKSAVAGNPGTFIMTNGDYLLFVWQQDVYPAFVILETTTQKPVEKYILTAGGAGIKSDLKGTAELVKYLQDEGWWVVQKDKIPYWLVTAVNSVSPLYALGIPYLPTFIVVPVGEDPTNFIDSLYPPEIIQ